MAHTRTKLFTVFDRLLVSPAGLDTSGKKRNRSRGLK
jgi:hypothetical protein